MLEKIRMGKSVFCDCGEELKFDFETNMKVRNTEISAKCPQCGNSVKISWELTGTQEGYQAGTVEEMDFRNYPRPSIQKKEETDNAMSMFDQ